MASWGLGSSGPARKPLEPTSFITKKTLEGPPGRGQSKPTQPDTQSVRTEQPDDAQGFFGTKTPQWSTGTAARPSWTPALVDHRLVPPSHHIPDLSRYIRDKVGPMWGRRGLELRSFHSIPWPLLSTESKATHGGASRAPPPHPVIFLLFDEGKALPMTRQPWISTELTPYQISLQPCCNPRF